MKVDSCSPVPQQYSHKSVSGWDVSLINIQMKLVWFLLCVVATGATVVEFPRNSFGDTFTNMAVHNGNIYIGAKNSIFILNSADLTVAQDRVSTCTGECNNINKMLLVNEKLGQLITCGTDHGGTCVIRSLSSVKHVVRRSTNTSEQDLDYLVVSSSEKRPASFVLTENEVYTGVTFGLGIKSQKTVSFNSYFYYLSSYSLASNKYSRDKSLKVQLFADAQTGIDIQLEDYVIYHKGGFEFVGFIYFVTNQRFKAGDSQYTSKLIRVCQNDTNPLLDRNQNSFYSYTDIKLECRKDGSIYNLIQDVTVFEPGEELRKNLYSNEKMLAATFASGSNPESPVSPSAVCLYRMEDVDQKIMEAKRNFITCPDNRLSEKESYLRNNLQSCLDNSSYSEEGVKCNKDLSILTYIIGDEASSLSAQAVFTVSHKYNHGFLGKIKASTTGKYTVLYTGTSAGIMIKLNVNSKETAEVFEEKTVDQGHPITGIQVENDGKIQYVMSDRMIVKYEMTDCDQYTTCESAMEARNPLCGWCVYENKTTFKENSSCPYQSYNGHWLSSLTQCLSLDVVPKGVAVSKAVNVKISVRDSLPQQLEGDIYKCIFKIGLGEEKSVAVYETDTGIFKCIAPNVVDHTDGLLELFVEHSGEEILLAETDFLFFDCDHYKKCDDCTGDDRASCSWDSFNTTCVSNNTSSDLLIQQKDSCPKFQNDDRYYIPSDVAKTLTFRVENLVNSSDIQYFCRLNDSNKLAAVKQDVNQINCTLEAITTISEEMYTIEIFYGRSEAAAAPLDGTNTVVVYNCSQLGRDCSICRSLKYKNEAYECGWCLATCIYSTAICSEPCPAPSVTKVVPSTAGIKGNIIVTVQGRELGSRVEEVDNIKLAGELCQPQPEDFIPSKQVTCLAGASAVKEGRVSVVVNNQRSTGNVMFSYKIPQLTEVVPAKGPKAGGTRLSIKRTDFGIGTRIVSAYVKDQAEKKKECSNAKVEPSVPVGVETSAVFHIECDTPAAEVGTMLESIEIIFDGGSTVQTAMNFTYLTNPEIKDILPLKAIQSGANPLRLTGKNLLNAHKGYITGDGETTHCILNSETEMICPSPKLSTKHVQDLMKKLNSSRKKRAADSDASISVEIIVHLDGVKQTFSIWYYSDPSFSSFEDENQVKLFDSATQKLTIKGEKLNLVAVKDDVNVTIGVGNCDVIELTSDNLTCVAPTNQPAPNVPGQSLPEVNVSIGNVHDTVGYLQYSKVDKPESVETWLMGAIIGCLLALFVIIALPFIWKYRQKSRESKDYKAFQKDVEERETEMRQIVREGNIELNVTTPTSSELDKDMQLVLKDHNLLIDSNLLQLGDLLGKGHFGSVYKGYLTVQNQATPTLVAVKTLHHNDPRQIDVQGFVDEAFVMKDFTHSRVLSLTGICLGMDHMPLVVLPYMKNGDLLKFIRDEKHTPSVRDLINFGIDISEGMSYLSGLKFVHRDLAARNCMLDDNFRVTVADFGLSRDIYEKEYYYCENKKTMLPVKWMALECLEKGKYSTKSDVWSFGIVLWELFTRGNHPYPDVDNWDIVRYLRQGRRLAQPQFCPDEMYKLMRECWLPNQSDRPEFSKIEKAIKDILAELEHGITQGEETKNIQTTYVNLETCTKCLYTNELMAPPDEDGILNDSWNNGNEEDPSSTHTYQDLEYPESAAAGYEELQARFCESAIE